MVYLMYFQHNTSTTMAMIAQQHFAPFDEGSLA